MEKIKNITPVPSGLHVRKTIRGKLYQRFFCYSRFTDNQTALNSAKNYLYSLESKSMAAGSHQMRNMNNCTGLVGVSWTCRKNAHRKTSVINMLRARVPGNDTKSYSITEHGLWNSYSSIAKWRLKKINKPFNAEDIINGFTVFIKTYLNKITEEFPGSAIDRALRLSLYEMVHQKNGPDEVVDLVRNIAKKSGIILSAVE